MRVHSGDWRAVTSPGDDGSNAAAPAPQVVEPAAHSDQPGGGGGGTYP